MEIPLPLGVGSFSMHCIEEPEIVKGPTVVEYLDENGKVQIGQSENTTSVWHTALKPFTRDTFSMAIKATYAEFAGENGKIAKMPIYKDPATDRAPGGDNMKKSQRGCCVVYRWMGEYHYEDGHTWEDSVKDNRQELVTVFKNGELVHEETLQEIRQRLNNGKF